MSSVKIPHNFSVYHGMLPNLLSLYLELLCHDTHSNIISCHAIYTSNRSAVLSDSLAVILPGNLCVMSPSNLSVIIPNKPSVILLINFCFSHDLSISLVRQHFNTLSVV